MMVGTGLPDQRRRVSAGWAGAWVAAGGDWAAWGRFLAWGVKVRTGIDSPFEPLRRKPQPVPQCLRLL